MESNHVRAVEDFIGKTVRRFIHVHRTGENDISSDGNFRGIGVSIIKAPLERRIVQADNRILLFFQYGNKLGKVMFRSGQVHFIKANDIHFLRMPFRIKKKLRKARVGRAVNHIFHIRIAEDISVIHP